MQSLPQGSGQSETGYNNLEMGMEVHGMDLNELEMHVSTWQGIWTCMWMHVLVLEPHNWLQCLFYLESLNLAEFHYIPSFAFQLILLHTWLHTNTKQSKMQLV